jgi:hypothetical protein
MKTIALVAAALALMLALRGTAEAADQIVGEILDLACYIPKRAKGPAHKKCAQTCAEHGMPLGLLTDDDTVYLLYPRHGEEKAFDAVKKLAGARARLTGSASERGALRGFEVHEATAAE